MLQRIANGPKTFENLVQFAAVTHEFSPRRSRIGIPNPDAVLELLYTRILGGKAKNRPKAVFRKGCGRTLHRLYLCRGFAGQLLAAWRGDAPLRFRGGKNLAGPGRFCAGYWARGGYIVTR